MRNRTVCNLLLHNNYPIFGTDMHASSIITGAADNSLHQSQYASSTLQRLRSASWDGDAGCSAVCYRGDGKLIASAHWDHSIRIHTSKKLKLVAHLTYHRDGATAVEFIPMKYGMGGLLLSGAKDGTVAIWDIYREKT